MTLERVAELVRDASGIEIKPTQLGSLRAALGRAAPGVSAEDFLARAHGAGGGALLERLLEEVTVQETYFLRDRRQLDAIEWHRLAELARSAGSDVMRVWSSGCATGEEAYTLALLACEAFASFAPPVRILATDISQAALEAAAAGRYRPRALRHVALPLRERYFTATDSHFEVGTPLRRLVDVRRHNLVRDPVPPLERGPFELIVCRNVFIYFAAPTIARVLERLEAALVPDGCLIVAAADALAGHAARPVPSPRPAPARARVLAGAVAAASHGHPREAAAQASDLLEADPLDADAYYVRGVSALEQGELEAAVSALRRALYVDPAFWLAAFTLARAHDARGDRTAARRSYEQALRLIGGDAERHEPLLEQIDPGDIAAACRARLEVLR